MINTNEIEAGDKVHLRCGGVDIVTPCGCWVFGFSIVHHWDSDGTWRSIFSSHPLDIIRIEKAPKLEVKTYFFAVDSIGCKAVPLYEKDVLSAWPFLYKITITDGEATI